MNEEIRKEIRNNARKIEKMAKGKIDRESIDSTLLCYYAMCFEEQRPIPLEDFFETVMEELEKMPS